MAGIGCRAGVSGEQVEAAIDAAIAELCARESAAAITAAAGERAVVPAPGITTAASASTPCRTAITAISTPVTKAEEPGIQAAAAARGVPLLAISQEALEAADPSTVTRSEHSMAAMNVHSVAEAAALAGALALAKVDQKPAPNDMATALTHRLRQPRIIVGPVTCALADTTAP